ncbi:TSC complex subunit 1b isoform X1 [Xiphophorus hellerii]|uniref:TSC complex subunit 1b isoform X1 n=1 Tax=Xiphophorus hellerii TaxID=8084 RepID=UPI0013B3A6B4|nr:hamartin-like isoform X1 [Xiphophorus hellerii]
MFHQFQKYRNGMMGLQARTGVWKNPQCSFAPAHLDILHGETQRLDSSLEMESARLEDLRAEKDDMFLEMSQKIASLQDNEKRLQEELARLRHSYNELNSKYHSEVSGLQQDVERYQQEARREKDANVERERQNLQLVNNLRAEKEELFQKMARKIIILRHRDRQMFHELDRVHVSHEELKCRHRTDVMELQQQIETYQQKIKQDQMALLQRQKAEKLIWDINRSALQQIEKLQQQEEKYQQEIRCLKNDLQRAKEDLLLPNTLRPEENDIQQKDITDSQDEEDGSQDQVDPVDGLSQEDSPEEKMSGEPLSGCSNDPESSEETEITRETVLEDLDNLDAMQDGSSSSTPFSTPRQPLPPPLSLPPLSGTQSSSSYRSPQTSRRQNSNSELNSSCGGKDPLWSPSSLCGMATPPSSRGMSPNLELSHSASHLPSRFHCTSGGKGTPASSTPATSSPPPTLSDDFPVISLPANTVQSSPPRKDRRPGETSKPGLVRQEHVREMEKSGEGAANRDAGSAANVTMTLTELSVFVTKQELDLQLRTEKEREEAAITEELMKLTEDKQELPGLRGYDSPFFHTTETLTGRQTQNPTSSTNAHPGGPIREPRYAASTPDRAENASGGGAGDRAAASDRSAVDRSWSFQSGFTPIDHHLLRSPSAPDDDSSKFEMFSPSPCGKVPVPYESLFALALPRAASLFVGQKTSEAVHKAAMERLLQREEGLEDGEEEGVVSASPLEVLDRLVQQGSDAHDKVLKRLPLPSKSADWTHFGGSAPLDELHTLRSQLLLLHNQLLYERYKREQHAVRNRRLLRRIINATALEEQNNAMKDQLNLQSVDIVSLRDSLQVEQQRYRQLWDDRETVVTRLHSQIRQLQQSRDDYYTKNQELQSKLQECQKRMDDLEAELQTANNKVGHTGHLLNQMTVKLSNSESSQQQMSFLNKQLLLLGEAHKLSMQDAQQPGMSNTKETEMLRMSHMKEVDSLRQSLLAQGQKLEAAQQRAAELETLLSKKEHLIAEQKKFLEDVKCQAKAELQASDCRFQAQRRITQLLQTELLQLYSQVEMEAPTAAGSSSPPGGRAETRTHPDCSGVAAGGLHAVKQPNSPSPRDSPRGTNGSTLSPGQPKASGSSSPLGSSMNGAQDLTPPLLMEPSALCPHAALPAADAPLTVGSYPSAKSFLGMKARELFRNKSESQCDDEQPPPRLAGLAHGLKTELCVEPGPAGPAAVTVHAKEPPPEPRLRPLGQGSPHRKAGPGQVGVRGPSGPRCPRQQLKIMDYNETHHEHS